MHECRGQQNISAMTEKLPGLLFMRQHESLYWPFHVISKGMVLWRRFKCRVGRALHQDGPIIVQAESSL